MEDDYQRKEKRGSIFKKLMHSYLSMKKEANKVAPTGCFSVYVGPEKQRFVIKTKYANHPLFKMLLEDAEMEYGFRNEGPLLLPCEVDLFCKVLAEIMDDYCGREKEKEFDDYPSIFGSCSPFNPARRRLGKSGMAKGCASYNYYATLTPRFAQD